MTGHVKRMDRVEERVHQGQENLRDELTHVKSQARVDQAQLIRKTDQCLVECLAQANKESEEREARMTREIERLVKDHDNTYAHTMTSLERRLDAKCDLMMRKLDEKSTERGERSRRTPKKPKSYKDDSDGCIDTWIEVMKLHFEVENLSKKQDCSALTSNLEGTALNCVMAKRANERDSARKIFDILLNRFGSGVQGHQAMVKFEKRFWRFWRFLKDKPTGRDNFGTISRRF